MARIGIVGSWHQALVYGAGFASLGHRVTGICHDAAAADSLNHARPPLFETGLEALMRRMIRAGRLKYTADYREGLAGARFAFISIDTPVRDDDSSDLGSIEAAARQMGRHLSASAVVCVSAQVPVGTCDTLRGVIAAERGGRQVAIAYVPEFLRLGTALETFRRADRVVVGADSPRVARRVADLYRGLKRPTFLTDIRTAEMAKHAANIFLATSISFMNEIADLSERTGADATTVAAIVKADRRVGPHAFLAPGLGYAGGTLGREIKALQRIGKDVGVNTRLLDAVDRVNAARPAALVDKIRDVLSGLSNRRIAVLGLTYKPGTSTMRRAVSLEIIRELVRGGSSVAAFDPLANLSELDGAPPFTRVPTPYDAAKEADAVVLITPWRGIDDLDLRRIARVMRRRVLFDTRNHFDPRIAQKAGFVYRGIGRSAGR